MATKMTKKDYFAIVRGIVDGTNREDKADILSFIDREVELLNKKSGSAKETKTQKANIAILATLREVFSGLEKPATITELMADERLASYTEETKDGVKTVPMTNQKLSSMVKKLVDAKEVVKTYDKKKAYFSLATADADADSADEAGTEVED